MNSIGLRHFSVVRRTVLRMSSTNSSYEDAICKLNSLQSNKSTIEQIKKGLKSGQKCTNIEDMENYLQRIGIPLSKLDELSVIHVAGTKGKGSTSAMCESILRRHGFRTGFYSSPHLVAARERIRLDGCPLSRDEFAEQLHHVYGLLWDSQEYQGDMPKYFAFLTVLAFHEFLRRRVDVAVVEVGIGGVVDYTNVLRKVPVVGITALGLDHTSILGHTLPEIAAAKAGVMKRGCDAYCVRQPADAYSVLSAYADYVKCPLTVVPEYTRYTFPETEKSHLPVDLDAYRTNASLAIQLSHAWMRATQTNYIHNNIDNHVNKIQNGLHSKINMNENGTHKDKNGLINGDIASHIKNNQNGMHDKVTNGTYKDQNGSQNNTINGTQKGTNDNQNGMQIKTENGIKNGTIKVQNCLTNGDVQNDANGLNSHNITNETQSTKYKYSGLQNKTANGLSNGNTMGKLVFEVPFETAEGLRQCKWPGRYQVVEGDHAKFYLDGAHTKESMEICAQWFSDTSSSANKTLIFSATGDRNAETLLLPLTGIPFRQIYFVIPTAYKVTSTNHDNYSLVEQEELIQRCRNHALIWQRNNSSTKITVLECVADALDSINTIEDKSSVLITGSLHLVGAALSILDPGLST